MVSSRNGWSSTKPKVGTLLTPTLNYFEDKGSYSYYSMRAFDAASGYDSTICGRLLKSALSGKASKQDLNKLDAIANSSSRKTCFIKGRESIKDWNPEHIYTYMKAAAVRDLYAFTTYKVTTIDTRVWKPFLDMDRISKCPYLKIINAQLYFALEHEHLFL